MMDKCEHEKNGHCLLNECLYGDFLFIDDSHFDSGKYCYCDDIKKAMAEKEQSNDN